MRSGFAKRSAAIAAAAALVFSMAACQKAPELSPQEVIDQASENFNGISSMTYTTEMAMDMTVMSQEISMTMNGGGEYVREPLATSMTMEMDGTSMGAGKSTIVMYVVGSEDEKGYTVYTGTGEEGNYAWTKQEVNDLEDAQKQMGAATSADKMNEYALNGTDYVEAGTEKVNGTEATRYDGVIPKESMADAMNSMNLTSMFTSMGLDEKSVGEYIDSLEDIKISIWVDKSNMMPVKYEMDMTDFMQSLMNAVMADMMNQLGQGETDVSEYITISNVIVDMVITGTDNVDSIEIPEEALNA
jgi:outer membrane lipoprotein-sorting protein